MSVTAGVVRGDDGVRRCSWGASTPDYIAYHDDEWGRPVVDDRRLFEKLCLEGFQSGLSWLTILRKRENFRAAFAGFDPEKVARFNRRSVDRLLTDAGIVRHRGKIESTINNAKRALEVAGEHGSRAAYVWAWEPGPDDLRTVSEDGDAPIPSTTPTSVALSKDLKRRGWTFVGPTTVYAFMQAMGLVNDHMPGCAFRDACEAARRALVRPGPQAGTS
jgi:DNA-3-methyladenine glycosylase I